MLSFSLTSSATSLLQRVLCSISSFFPYFYAISSKRRKTENYQISSSRFLLANDVERSNEEEQTSVGSIWSKIKCDTGKRIPVLGFPGGEWCRGFEDLVRTSPVRLTMAFPPMINNATGLNRIHDFSFVSFLSLSSLIRYLNLTFSRNLRFVCSPSLYKFIYRSWLIISRYEDEKRIDGN